MNVNENSETGFDARNDVVELGVASTETKGQPGLHTEVVNQFIMPGISEE